MRLKRRSNGLLAAAFVANVVFGAQAKADVTMSDVREMARVFDLFCLHAFPDISALDRLAKKDGAEPLTSPELASYLHNDPGKGWYYATPAATYVLTVERPPYQTCALRRMTPSGFPTVKPYLEAIKSFAETHGNAHLVLVGQQNGKTANGIDITAFAQSLQPSDTEPASDTFIVVLTNYHGRYAGALSRDVGEGTAGVEVRFARQVAAPR